MTWERLILLSKETTKKTFFQTHGVPATGDWICAPWLQQHSVSIFFWGHPEDKLYFIYYENKEHDGSRKQSTQWEESRQISRSCAQRNMTEKDKEKENVRFRKCNMMNFKIEYSTTSYNQCANGWISKLNVQGQVTENIRLKKCTRMNLWIYWQAKKNHL